MTTEHALIVGAGSERSASLARRFARESMAVALAGRSPGKLEALAAETGARTYRCDVADPGDVAALFAGVDRDLGAPDLVVFNASARVRGPVQDQIGRAHVCTPVTNAHLVCRRLLEKKKNRQLHIMWVVLQLRI